MTTEEYIIKTSDELLDVLLDHRKQNPDFKFWLRSKDSTRSDDNRLESGQWFIGSDYIFLAFYNRGDWKNKTRTFGFVINAHKEKLEMYVEWVYNIPKHGLSKLAPREDEFYERLPEIFPKPKKIYDRRFQWPVEGTDVAQTVKKFLNDQKPKVDKLLAQLNLQERYTIPTEKFEKRLSKTLSLRAALKEGRVVPHSTSKNDHGPHYWIIAPGENGRKWDDFCKEGIVGIGWDSIGDLSEYDDREEVRKQLFIEYPDSGTTQMHNSLCLWEFAKVMKPGDILIPKKGAFEYLGYGIVTGDYEYDDSREEYYHLRTVEWKKKGVWPEEVNRIVTKTLTDITKYPEYVDRLRRLIGIEQEAIIPKQVNYWWINANPSHWRITDFEVGQEQTYTTLNEKGNKRTKYEYFAQVKAGDLLLGYASSPVKKIVAIFEATRSVYTNDDSGNEEIAFVIQKFLPEPVSIDSIIDLPEFKDAEVRNNRQGSLYKLTSEQYHAVLKGDIQKEEGIQEYSKADALSLVFMEEQQFDDTLAILKHKKNIILQGPPGTGKTFMAKLLAYALMEERDNSRIEMIQFHQSYSYEDFMQGYRPTESGAFRLENGVFYRFCKRAQADPDREYVFIIDEINRGNLSKIFGELMLLLESDKRGPGYDVPLTYSQGLGSKFYIPSNVHVIGTMNTADRSLSIVDYALRRRFAFIDVTPTFNGKFRQFLDSRGVNKVLVDKICVRIGRLNENITKTIGPGFAVGHSYFCNLPAEGANEQWYQHVVRLEVGPLLREYWFDKVENAELEIEALLR
jgi:5-methylcytosine-specific restriction protein B